ncbi:hypothetical protein FOL47_011303 [Perkinsus chesapeaki]|uniref:Uncharacterized protein n=1 Tax=Perkinsus chesapeaki TaxID=330153 RepID=A0A7J6KYN4_PERCH|nr:hypothetical protein FOL47_011303 [Perkinsus chesapeaki]
MLPHDKNNLSGLRNNTLTTLPAEDKDYHDNNTLRLCRNCTTASLDSMSPEEAAYYFHDGPTTTTSTTHAPTKECKSPTPNEGHPTNAEQASDKTNNTTPSSKDRFALCILSCSTGTTLSTKGPFATASSPSDSDEDSVIMKPRRNKRRRLLC